MVRPILTLLLCLMLLPAPARAGLDPHRREVIQSLFPSATVIGERRADLPVYPVYQLQELLGYAYESTDLSHLQGFAGKPIRMMIGLDTRGRFTGVRVLEHHEPVFLHGLGEAPLFDFVSQYAGHSLREQILIRTGSEARGKTVDGDPVYFDGVSKATVSVLIINDTVLSSALKVARQTLADFAQAPPTRVRPDVYRPLDWPGLLDQGFVSQARISAAQVEQALGRPLADYPEPPAVAADGLFSELYVAYLNAPMVGRNLLGDAGYRALMARLEANEHVLLVASRGPYPHVGPEFVPGSTPERIGLVQNRLAVEIRDLNWLDASLGPRASGQPAFDAVNLFRVAGNAGFNPGAPSELRLHVELARNHLVHDRTTVTLPVRFNEALFEPVAATDPDARRTPVWQGIWRERAGTVAVLVVALALLTLFFTLQRRLTRWPRLVHGFRWGFLAFTLLFLGLYAQGQLSVVNIYTLLLALWDGFSLDVFLLDPVLFLLWSYTVVTLVLWGRGLFCGWLCPFGALQEMVAWLGSRLRLRQVKVPERWHRRLILLKYPILLGLVATAGHSLTLAEQLAEVEPFKTSITLGFVRAWPFVLYALALLAAGLFIHKFYCRYLCPLGAGLAVLGRLRRFHWLTRIERCGTPCQRCRHRCGINAIRRDGAIDYNECIQCLECVVILRDPEQCVDSLLRRKQARRSPARIPVREVPATTPRP